MNAKVEDQASKFDIIKWVLVVAIVVAGVVGNTYFSDESLLYRVLALIVMAGVAVAIALQTAKGAAFWGLIKDARIEIRKVVWPTHQETLQTTFIVVALTLVMALILWMLDSVLGWAISKIIG
ncbi:protein translocase subunit secE/sec61 gamma [Sinobacterium caligoides]|uniref:Protein translocase subunit SecE n=1 Tax=Sinobacterium caligoides TaxID=933926 RepID=A0A3N2D4U6_9GAMM|nr:preprotein translocase subunit SecE [Sinobacterium caligoides]ROR94800.1 protein translocase subunit secE/sec61 gamma [Sinobacterium caligoides]